jgi:cytochrome P450
MVRRIVLGPSARDDVALNDLLDRLRRRANWAVLPVHRRDRDLLAARIASYVADAEPDTLAGSDVASQIPHWLFAFDAAGMVALRTLALLSTHPEHAAKARADHGYLRACVRDTVRLWPTTPALLRENTTPVTLGGHHFPARTTFLLYTPFLHRTRPPAADIFDPDQWGHAQPPPGLVPFSAGPARCPGENLVLHLTTTLLATLLTNRDFTLTGPQPLTSHRPLPHTLDNFRLRFQVRQLSTV